MAKLIELRSFVYHLCLEDFRYNKMSGTVGQRAYWRCKKYPECRARAMTIGGPENVQLVKGATSDHVCIPDVDAAEEIKVVSGNVTSSINNMVKLIEFRSPIYHLCLEDFLYYKIYGSIGKRAYWRYKNHLQCCARAVTIGGPENLQLVKGATSDHMCIPGVDAAEEIKVVSGIIRKAEVHPEAPPAQVLRTKLKYVPSGNFHNLIQLQSLPHSDLLNENIGNIIRL
ncbi:hypothetical protein TKK_0000925 [Trichogramma kaykai]